MNTQIRRRFRLIAPMHPESPTMYPRTDGTWFVGVVYESGIGNRYQVSVNEFVPFAGTLFKLLGNLDQLERDAHKELGRGENAKGRLIGSEDGRKRDNHKTSPKVTSQMGRALL